jgi:hypothetical protein
MLDLTPQELQRLREISIFDILNVPDKGRRVGIPCPVHQGRNDNFNLYPNNSYYCFKCGAVGSNGIDLIRDLKSYPKKMSSDQFVSVIEELVHYL